MNDSDEEVFDPDFEADVFDNDIEDAMTMFYQTKDGQWLLEAIRRSGQYGKPLCARVSEALNGILEKYRSGEARTLDEAFGVSRPGNWSQSAVRARSRKTATGMSVAGAVWHSVISLHMQGRPIDEALFEEVGEKYGVSWSTARNYYRECKALMEQGD
ncbi:MAG: hypothetical protein B7Y26_13490 [Hydrogenophilales bacterium 16-64-46]|nr:MAG: hypothetical protein B7Z32_13500 [Hydrogenophilales bacterium 12-64-13]OYZ04022.1 MAG: hypothetical protein B7Y26_13490 [Hydrogenophilales bacterium 16-64-46]OZA36660.1 MAG: hypothetical protein B7X87_13640 [Hydrogenophilales bacterium 17-64-34]HQT01145.1 hypothetical protein [Thiobacillus sp.]